jgi:hypothetical protein
VRAAALLLALLLQGCGWYFLERDPNEVAKGAVAPSYTLPSHLGGQVSLADLRAQGDVVLVFYRGHW